MNESPTITDVDVRRRVNGMGGQYCHTVKVSYSDGSEHWTTFYGNVHGGPITVTSAGIQQTVAVQAGPLTPEWIRSFYGLTNATLQKGEDRGQVGR